MTTQKLNDDYSSLPTAQARYRARLKAKKLCLSCAKPAKGMLCDEHRVRYNEYAKAYRGKKKIS